MVYSTKAKWIVLVLLWPACFKCFLGMLSSLQMFLQMQIFINQAIFFFSYCSLLSSLTLSYFILNIWNNLNMLHCGAVLTTLVCKINTILEAIKTLT